ncbi:ACN9-domain-containing protein [Gonapodya prolifera JEL478]|uniref:Succinate dehydrogenase assembly factor 3 n=1 Tax=Gonapodya prolifera (strain JEL478) TaxID=1344416 RepID=A0A139A1M3_GONPJ|nr:ACN9-domain-containing protein [Gonapodya prolifera JEL478]|eukprot:KXS10690.1 ACN9-domain-containing protein [Gonapodya prolifera JEL478]
MSVQPLRLYRSIFKLHRQMPPALRYIGDSYVRDEFKRHKEADDFFVEQFMNQWSSYLHDMADQLQASRAIAQSVPGASDFVPEVGRNLPSDALDKMTDQQIGQLWALKEEAKKIPENAGEGGR